MRTRCAQTGMPGRSSGVIEIDSDREESCVGDAPDGAVEAELLLGRRRRQTALSGDDESSADDGDNDEHDAYLHRCKQAAGQEEEEPSDSDEDSDEGSDITEEEDQEPRQRCKYIDDEAEETDAEESDEVDSPPHRQKEADDEAEEAVAGDASEEGSPADPDSASSLAALKERFCAAYERLQWARRPAPSLPVPRPRQISVVPTSNSDADRKTRKPEGGAGAPRPKSSVGAGRRKSTHWETLVSEDADLVDLEDDEVILVPKSTANKPNKTKTRFFLDEEETPPRTAGRAAEEEEEMEATCTAPDPANMPGRTATTTSTPTPTPTPRRRLLAVDSSDEEEHTEQHTPGGEERGASTPTGEKDEGDEEGTPHIAGWRETRTPRRRLQALDSSDETEDPVSAPLEEEEEEEKENPGA